MVVDRNAPPLPPQPPPPVQQQQDRDPHRQLLDAELMAKNHSITKLEQQVAILETSLDQVNNNTTTKELQLAEKHLLETLLQKEIIDRKKQSRLADKEKKQQKQLEHTQRQLGYMQEQIERNTIDNTSLLNSYYNLLDMFKALSGPNNNATTTNHHHHYTAKLTPLGDRVAYGTVNRDDKNNKIGIYYNHPLLYNIIGPDTNAASAADDTAAAAAAAGGGGEPATDAAASATTSCPRYSSCSSSWGDIYVDYGNGLIEAMTANREYFLRFGPPTSGKVTLPFNEWQCFQLIKSNVMPKEVMVSPQYARTDRLFYLIGDKHYEVEFITPKSQPPIPGMKYIVVNDDDSASSRDDRPMYTEDDNIYSTMYS